MDRLSSDDANVKTNVHQETNGHRWRSTLIQEMDFFDPQTITLFMLSANERMAVQLPLAGLSFLNIAEFPSVLYVCGRRSFGQV